MPTWIIAAAIALLLLGPVLEVCFVFCYTVAALLERGIWMPTSMRILARVFYVIGAIADALYCQTYGRAWFALNWRGFFGSAHGPMFSNTVQWHCDHSDGEQLAEAVRWATLLNAVRPGHIKRLDSAQARLAAPGEGRELGDTAL